MPIIYNVILFGEAGSGKSSLVNMIVGDSERRVAETSDKANGCTFKNDAYEVTMENAMFRIHDTTGLNEGDQGRVPHWKAIRGLYTLIRRLDGVSLLIYCMRGRIKENAKSNWILFNKVICAEKVPIIAVVTGLEGRSNPDDWWREEDNKKAFEKNEMRPTDVGCVVSFRGNKNQYAELYNKSQVKLRHLIKERYLQKPWSRDKDRWLSDIYQTVYHTSVCFVSQNRLEYSAKMRGVILEFIKEMDMKEEDSKMLESTLLKAEEKLEREGGLAGRWRRMTR